MCMANYGQHIVVGREKGINGAKARTRQEREIVKLHDRLPAITPTQRRWMENLFDKVGYYRSKKVRCSCCGGDNKVEAMDFTVLTNTVVSPNMVCEHCGQRIDIVPYAEAPQIHHGDYVDYKRCIFINNINEYTVFRVYWSSRSNVNMLAGSKPTEYEQKEIFEIWMSDDGKEKIFSAEYNRGTYHFTWLWDKPWKFAKHNGHATGYYVFDDVYDIYGSKIYGRAYPTHKARRNGFTNAFLHDISNKGYLSASDALRGILTDRLAEEFAKTRQYGMLAYLMSHPGVDLSKRMYAVHICNRNKYIIQDADIWIDHLDLLEYFGKDTHNAKYICPEHIDKEHLRLSKKKTEIEKKKEAMKMEREYQHYRKKYFNIQFGTKDISISVLKSVKEFYEEGEKMHHCVAGYCNIREHPHSLILSARDSQGERIETIEVNLKTRKVVQSRGIMNSATPKHDEIVRLTENFFKKYK